MDEAHGGRREKVQGRRWREKDGSGFDFPRSDGEFRASTSSTRDNRNAPASVVRKATRSGSAAILKVGEDAEIGGSFGADSYKPWSLHVHRMLDEVYARQGIPINSPPKRQSIPVQSGGSQRLLEVL